MKIRELDPGAAWNEAERRALPFAFVGFFLGELVGIFNDRATPLQSLLIGASGAVGLFIGTVAFLIGFYSKRLRLALMITLLGALPIMTAMVLILWIRSDRLALIVATALVVVAYLVLHHLHQKLSSTSLAGYVRQLAYDRRGDPQSKWGRVFVWLMLLLGAVTVFALITKT